MNEKMEFASRRSVVFGRRGMVAASQPLAVAAGLEVLALGGNAADAAVAVAAALNVTEPTSTGIGGDCFALYFDADTGQVTALNGSGRAPGALNLARLQREGFSSLPAYHPYTITVPGACAGWCDLLARHGRLPLGRVLAPAIRLAEEGVPVAPVAAYFWDQAARGQLRTAPGGHEMTLDGRAPRAGEIFRNPGLAATLKMVAEGGKEAFYEGPIAEAMASVVQKAGGCLTTADLAAHVSTWERPIHTLYRDARIWECPPNGQGLTALIALNILEGFDLSDLPPLSAERLHLEIEALRLAFADTRWFVADPATNPAPLELLLSKEYAAQRRRLIDPQKACLDKQRGVPIASSDTVYLSVIDGAGNACSFINSNYMGFGTGIVPPGYGFTLQNRGHNFSLDPKHPNALRPGKRPYHTIIPALATRVGPDNGPDVLYGSFGVMGGFMQPQGHMQVLTALLDDRLDAQTALDRPRFCIEDGTSGGLLAMEQGIPTETLAELSRRGHQVRLVSGYERALFGRGQIILRDPDSGVLTGGSDPRADGCAMTY
ncbi:MAG: gamma-glutamyltransferase family protein [Smithellaceae bacterium]|nr:gamma-glutamyltransferase family protein [Smithellaceae bacterium]